MDELKLTGHKEFNKLIKGRGFKGRSDHKSKDLKAKFSFKPLYYGKSLTVSLNGMEPAMFDSIWKASRAIGVGEGVIRYARNNGRDYVRKIKG